MIKAKLQRGFFAFGWSVRRGEEITGKWKLVRIKLFVGPIIVAWDIRYSPQLTTVQHESEE